MKAKFLLALALPIAFAACTNEDDTLGNVTTQAKGEKIASGMILKADRNLSGATTRLTEDGWEAGDLVGLGWINNAASNGVITDDQGESYDDLLDGGTDSRVYNNMQFAYNDGQFTSTEDVYKGAYFAYYPFSRQGAAKQMEITLNGTQKTADAEEAYFDGVFSISARDFIESGDVNEDNLVEKQFSLKNIANALAIKTTLKNPYQYSDEQMAEMKVTNVELSLGTSNKLFANVIKIDPQKLPKAQYDAVTGDYDEEKTLKGMTYSALVGTGKAIEAEANVEKLSVAVDNGATLATENNGFVLFTLPTTAQAVDKKDVTLTIRTLAGKHVITYRDDAMDGTIEANNNKTIEKLVALLSTDGYKAEDGKTYKLSTILNARVGLDFQIDMDQDYFTPIMSDIQSAEEWNAAVKFADSFYKGKAQAFKITGDIVFTKDEPMTLPAAGLSSVTAGTSETVTFKSGSHAINQKIAKWGVNTTINSDASLTVGIAADKKPLLTLTSNATITNNGTLNVNGEIAADAASSTITNETKNPLIPATINVGVDGKINSQKSGSFTISVDSKDGSVITVGYNSYVHYSQTPAGTVIGIIDGNDATAKEYYAYLITRMKAADTNMTKSGTAEAPVMCNTIELRNITVTENDEANITSSDLPWAGAGEYKIETTTFKDIDVILNNASLVSETTTAMQYKTLTTEGTSALNGVFSGAGVQVESGTLSVGRYTVVATKKAANGKITITSGDLDIAKGATLNVTRSTISKPATLTNEGTINLTGEKKDNVDGIIEAVKIVNKATGVITVGVGGKMTYAGAGNFTQDGQSSGNIISEPTAGGNGDGAGA